MNAPAKESLPKALEQIIKVAEAGLASADRPMRLAQLATILRHGHEQIRTIARTARGDSRWGRRPSLEPLPPKDDA